MSIGFLSAPSPFQSLVATVSSNVLTIHPTKSSQPHFCQHLDPTFVSKCKTLRFYTPPFSKPLQGGGNATSDPSRLFLASDASIHVFDARSPSYHSTITNATGPTTRLSHVSFLSPDHILVVPEFAPKASIYDLATGLTLDVKDPKPILRGNNVSVRPTSGHVALLTRSTGKDIVVVLLLNKQSLAGISEVPVSAAKGKMMSALDNVDASPPAVLETTIILDTLDASGLRWSPDGRWLCVWETASQGASVYIYTPDGHLFRRWTHPDNVPAHPGLGVRICEWDVDGRWLWVGLGAGKVIGLGSKTFRQQVEVRFPPTLEDGGGAAIWEEQIIHGPRKGRIYATAQLPAVPPAPGTSLPESSSSITSGISHLCPSSRHLASISASAPTTVHIHSISSDPASRTPVLTQAVLIHHAPIKTLAWHPTRQGTLMIVCAGAVDVVEDRATCWVHIWDERLDVPRAISVDVLVSAGRRSAAGGIGSNDVGGVNVPQVSWAWVGTAISEDLDIPDSAIQVLASTPVGSVLAQVFDEDGFGSQDYDKRPGVNAEAEEAVFTSSLKSSIPITGEGPEDAFDEGYSMDLSPVALGKGTRDVDDTFGFKKGRVPDR